MVNIPKSLVCIAAIIACKQAGIIKDLAKFDPEKAKRCLPAIIISTLSCH